MTNTSELSNWTVTREPATNQSSGGNGSLSRDFASDDDFMFDQPYALHVTEQIAVYGQLVLAPVGITFNIISFFVFLFIRSYRFSTGLHLICMTIADSLAILGIFMREAGERFFGYIGVYIFGKPTVPFCMAMAGLIVGPQLWSTLLVTSATVERFLAVAFALKVKHWSMLEVSRVLLTLYFVVSATMGCLNGSAFREVGWYGSSVYCEIPSEWWRFQRAIATIAMTSLANGALPCLIFIFTVLIAVSLYRHKRARVSLTQTGSEGNSGTHARDTDAEFKITIMLFVIAVLFLVARVTQTIVFRLMLHSDWDSPLSQHSEILWPLTMLVMVTTHSVHFVLYMIFFVRFRRAFLSCVSKLVSRDVTRDLETGSGNDPDRKPTKSTDVELSASVVSN